MLPNDHLRRGSFSLADAETASATFFLFGKGKFFWGIGRFFSFPIPRNRILKRGREGPRAPLRASHDRRFYSCSSSSILIRSDLRNFKSWSLIFSSAFVLRVE